jgi:hypothetical protein
MARKKSIILQRPGIKKIPPAAGSHNNHKKPSLTNYYILRTFASVVFCIVNTAAVFPLFVADMLSFAWADMTIIPSSPVNIPADMTLFPVQAVSFRPGNLAASNTSAYAMTFDAGFATNCLRFSAVNCKT